MTFSSPEREWLRLAAMSSPDTPIMETLIGPHFDWPEVEHLALCHQLLGVLCHRLQPGDLRRDGVIGVLEENGNLWKGAAVPIMERLKAVGIPFILPGNLPCNGLYPGLSHWPKYSDDLDIAVPSSRYDDLQAALPELGLSSISVARLSMEVASVPQFPHFLQIMTFPRAHDLITREGCFGDPIFYEKIQHLPVGGLLLPVPHAEAWLVLHAACQYDALIWNAGPLSLGTLSRLHNIARSTSGFDWNQVLAIIRHFADITERRIEAGAKSGLALPLEEQPEVVRRQCISRAVPWLLKLADRIYPFIPADFWADLDALISQHAPLALARVDEIVMGSDYKVPEYLTYCEWQALDVEHHLFEVYGRGLAHHLEAGIWRPYGNGAHLGVAEVHWCLKHLPPINEGAP